MANLLNRIESEPFPGIFTVVCEDDVEDLQKYGQGSTIEAAREQWGFLIVEHVDDVIFDLRAAGVIDAETADECFTDIDGLTYIPY